MQFAAMAGASSIADGCLGVRHQEPQRFREFGMSTIGGARVDEEGLVAAAEQMAKEVCGAG